MGVDVKETECEDMYLTHLAQKRLQWLSVVNTVISLQVP
jgi:hypothetical protein